jgi:hypothetical protein
MSSVSQEMKTDETLTYLVQTGVNQPAEAAKATGQIFSARMKDRYLMANAYIENGLCLRRN